MNSQTSKGKPGRKKHGPKAKNTVQDDLPKPQTPQLDLFGEF